MPVAQVVAGLDPLDDVDRLASLPGPHRSFPLPDALHDMGGAGRPFQPLLLEAVAWTLDPAAPADPAPAANATPRAHPASAGG